MKRKEGHGEANFLTPDSAVKMIDCVRVEIEQDGDLVSIKTIKDIPESKPKPQEWGNDDPNTELMVNERLATNNSQTTSKRMVAEV